MNRACRMRARATYVLCQITPVPPAAGGVRRSLKLGIGGRSVLGLAAVAVVILVGHTIATETTRRAVDAVREMQNTHEPIARRAGTIVERLVAYDRAVSEYMQAARAPDENSIARAAAALEASMAAYFDGNPKPDITPAVSELRLNVDSHISHGRALASQAVQRADWVARRTEALAHVQARVVAAGGTGVRIDEDQVFARRSLADLASAATSLRSGTAPAPPGRRKKRRLPPCWRAIPQSS